MPNCAKRSVRRASFGEGNAPEGSNSRTSPAICVSYSEASNWVILSMPHFDASRLSHRDWMSLPSGVTTPMPVTTTRRSVQFVAIKTKWGSLSCPQPAAPGKTCCPLLPLGIFDILYHIAHGLQLFGFFIRNLLAKFLFQGHHELHGVERVGA